MDELKLILSIITVAAAVLAAVAKRKQKRRAKESHLAKKSQPEQVPEIVVGPAPPPDPRLQFPKRVHRTLAYPYYAEFDREKRRHDDHRRALQLPEINSPDELWRFLNLKSFRELVHLADANHRQVSGPKFTVTQLLAHATRRAMRKPITPQKISPPSSNRWDNYWIRYIPKRGGGFRVLAIPKPRLKAAQRIILREILDKVPLHPAAKGFRRDMDITHHAGPHVGRNIVVAFDLEHFFPTIHRRRVRGLFEWLGYPPSVAHILSLLVTTVDGAGGPGSRTRHLPQGAPTSPAIANAVCFRLDCRLDGLAQKFGGKYTRYADDIAFSGDAEFKRGLTRFIPMVEKIIRREHFRLHPKKRRFMRHGRAQRVTGLLVNDQLSVGRAEYDVLKAILHNARREGSLESQNREGLERFDDHIRGRIAWVARFHPSRGEKLLRQFNALQGLPDVAPPPPGTTPSLPPPE